MVTVSAPGKIFLMGEHAVVYGHPALLSAISRRLSVTIKKNESQIRIHASEPPEYLEHILGVVQRHMRLDSLPFMDITVVSDLPAGYHLGSSAALAAATVGAVMVYVQKIWNPTVINKLAYEAERFMHGNPSGADNTAVTFGGIIWYRKELEFLKSIWQLPFAPHARLGLFYLVNTGKPVETTGEMVAMVKKRTQNSMASMKRLFDENETQVKRIAVALKEGDQKTLMDAMQKGERTLEDMGVVSRPVSLTIREIERFGGAAKILGGGGRKENVGFLLCYHPDGDTLETICHKQKYVVDSVSFAKEGIRIEHQ